MLPGCTAQTLASEGSPPRAALVFSQVRLRMLISGTRPPSEKEVEMVSPLVGKSIQPETHKAVSRKKVSLTNPSQSGEGLSVPILRTRASHEFTSRLKGADIRISWDSRGRALDNIFVERLRLGVKYR